jgi:hypothetical protein
LFQTILAHIPTELAQYWLVVEDKSFPANTVEGARAAGATAQTRQQRALSHEFQLIVTFMPAPPAPDRQGTRIDYVTGWFFNKQNGDLNESSHLHSWPLLSTAPRKSLA